MPPVPSASSSAAPSGPNRQPLGVVAVMLAELDFDAQVALCAELGVTHYVYRPRIIADDQRDQPFSNWGNHKFDLTPTRLIDEGAALSEKLREAGLVPYGTVPAVTSDAADAVISEHVAGARACGAGCVRINPRSYPREGLFDYDALLEQLREDYRRVLRLAEPAGVKVVIEMHTGNAACSAGLARAIVSAVDPTGTKLGLIFDLPNACREGYVAPTLSLSACGPWIDHVHIGGARVVDEERDEHGCRRRQSRFVPLRDADLNATEWVRHLGELAQRLGRDVPLVIEDYTPDVSSEARLRDCVAVIRAVRGEG